MNSKRVLFLASTLAIIIISSQFANAGWLSNFFGKEPRLSAVPVTVGVVTNSIPSIVRFFEPPTPWNPPFDLVMGTTSPVYVGFVAQDTNGANDLPGANGAQIFPGDVNGVIQSPFNSVVGTAIQPLLDFCTAFDCTTAGNLVPACDPSNYAIQKAYICQFTVAYSYPHSTFSTLNPNANDLWKIQLSVRDLQQAVSLPATSGDVGFTTMPQDYLRINGLSAYNIPPSSSISWTGLSMTASNQPAAGPITIENYGNLALGTTQITASNLNGATTPSARLSASAFSASGSTGGASPAECDVPTQAIQLQPGITVTIPGVSIPYTAQGASVDKDNAYFCAYQSLNTPGILTGSDSSFSGTWTIVAS